MIGTEKGHSSHVYPVLSCVFEDGSIRDLSFFGDSNFKNVLAAWDDMAYSFEQDDTISESLSLQGCRRVLKTASLSHSDGIYMMLEDGTLQVKRDNVASNRMMIPSDVFSFFSLCLWLFLF